MFNILIIDDVPDIHDSIKAIFETPNSKSKLDAFKKNKDESALETPSYHFASAMNGQEGVDKYNEKFNSNDPFDIIICDIRMPPGINGKETAERILKLNENALILFCSAYSDFREADLKSLSKGNNNINLISKPFSVDDIKILLKNMSVKVEKKS